MNKILMVVVLALSFGLASLEADAAKRFGGGSNLGKQRPAPTQKEAVQPASPAAPAAPAQAAPAPAKPAAAAPAQPQGFMSKWGGLLAGLGIGALLGSLFSGGMGGFGMLLALLLAGIVVFAVVRMLASRRAPAPEPVQFAGAGPAGTPSAEPTPSAPPAPASPVRFQGIGSRLAGTGEQHAAAPVTAASAPASVAIPGFEREPFLRVAKTSFIRLQAANDAKDLDDIRDYTTPEMYAELSMIIRERGDAPQKTEVVSVEAQLVEAVVEGDWEIASVRFYGLIREDNAANPEPFDEIWHVRKKAGERKASWLIAGIQQNG